MNKILSILGIVVLAGSAFAQTSVAPTQSERDNSYKSEFAMNQSSNTNPPAVLTFAPGSSWSLDYVAIPPQRGYRHWDTSACVASPWAVMPLGRGFSLQSDLLGGLNLSNGSLTAGYDLDLSYTFALPTMSEKFWFVAKLGGAQLFGESVKPVPGINGSISVTIAVK